MKKVTLLTAAALTIACLAGHSITTHAAPTHTARISLNSLAKRINLYQNGNKVFFAYGCNIQDILGKLENCFPQINLPETDAPETNIPEIETPGTNTPETNLPEINIPENDNNSNDNIIGDATPEEDSSSNNMHAFIKEVVDLVNAERAKEGHSPLTLDIKVQAAAQVRATECEQSFSHTRPDGSSFATALKEQNVSYRGAGENIAWGQRSPQAVMNAWMNSAGHRANIMNPNFTTIGVGYYQNANGTNYWCQLFTR